MTDYLDLDDLSYLITHALGQDPQIVVRDWGLLESAVYRPQSTVFGTEAYPDVHAKAAALLHSLTRNHPLLDGNKRLAWLSTRLFYVRNELDLHAPSAAEGDEFVRAVAGGQVEMEDLPARLRAWCAPLTT